MNTYLLRRKTLVVAALLLVQAPLGRIANAEVIWPENRDDYHVCNGCFLSASRYAERFLNSNAQAQAEVETVVQPGGEKHSIAILHEGGRTWGRDECVGIFRIVGDIQKAYDSAVRRWFHTASAKEVALRTRDWRPQTFDERMTEVKHAQSFLPRDQTSEIRVISTTQGPIPVLVWNPSPGRGAVYEPSFGTARADTKLTGEALARAALLRVGFQLKADAISHEGPDTQLASRGRTEATVG